VTDTPRATFYRRHSRDRLSQGDIALSEVVQVRSASGSESGGPGPAEAAAADLPYLGAYADHELPVSNGAGGEAIRILRVWTTYAIVLSQNCEVEWANPSDSRVAIAPIVTREQWPEAPWDLLPRTPPPGYVYLPPLELAEATALGLEHPWPESVVVLASSSTTTRRIIMARRLLSLSVGELSRLQDAVARFYGVRGFADLPALQATIGKPIREVVETGQVISGPSSLVKVYFGSDDGPDADDEVTVSYWGVRPTTRRPPTTSS
jgi:hypothetical protein